MMWIPCILIECSGFHAAWRNGTLWNAVDIMQHDWMKWIPAAWLNAVDFLQHVPKHLFLMQWIPCSVIECRDFHSLWRNGSRLCAVESMQRGQMHLDWMQWILYSMAQTSRLNAVDSMQHDWMQCIPCSVVKCILIERSAYHAVWLNGSWLNAVDSMQRHWIQGRPCIGIECSGIHAAW